MNTPKLLMFVIVIAGAASLLIGAITFIEQTAKAQNMTAPNMTGTDNASGDISSFRALRERLPP
ncbi:MAG TPA: hypothetical protein VE130_03390 [Nitrososphaeraceae archaeon]|jgi:hypothetical protein|nr:hypothetical protein [Nitrososphaeraceae archaeon]